MITSNISMPHPVLGVAEDISGAFHVSFNIIIDKASRTYIAKDIKTEISNEYIHSLFKDGILNLVIKLSCIPTYKTWTFINPTQLHLPENEIDLLLEVESYLIAAKQYPTYFDKSFNKIFENKTFSLEEGDIVALTGSRKIPIEKENEKASLGSIFRFSKISKDAEIQELYFDFEEDQIVIHYPNNNPDFDPVTLLFDKSQGAPFTALNLYIIPALTEGYRIVEEESNTYEDYRWFNVLDGLLPESERTHDYFINAQKALKTGLPINLAFEELLKIKNLRA